MNNPNQHFYDRFEDWTGVECTAEREAEILDAIESGRSTRTRRYRRWNQAVGRVTVREDHLVVTDLGVLCVVYAPDGHGLVTVLPNTELTCWRDQP